jgi:hypothetical protein
MTTLQHTKTSFKTGNDTKMNSTTGAIGSARN